MKTHYAPPFAAALLFCLLAGTVTWAQSQGEPSLADVARKKSAAKAKRVITNDEVPPSPQANQVPAVSSDPAKTASVKPAKQDAKPESASEPQAKLQQLTNDQQSLLNIIKTLEEKVAATTDSERKATLNQVIKHARESLDENQRQIDVLKGSAAAVHEPVAEPSAPASAPK